MNQLAQEKEESNFDWFKLQNNNLENTISTNIEHLGKPSPVDKLRIKR